MVLNFFFILLLSLFVSNNSVSGNTGPVNFTTGEWGKFLGKDLKDKGCLAKVLKESFGSVHKSVEFTFMVWSGAFERAKAGRHDGSLYWYKTDERLKHFIYPKNHIRTDSLFFYYKPSKFKDFKSWRDLIGKRVVINESYYYPKRFIEYANENSIELIKLSTEEQMVNFTSLDRADVFLSAEKVISSLELAHFKKSSIAPLKLRGYVIFPVLKKLSQKHATDFDKGFYKLMHTSKGKHLAKTCPGLNKSPIR